MTISTRGERSQILDRQLNESRRSAFLREILTNSGHFLILNSLSEIALMGWGNYLYEPAHYLILFAMLAQAWYLSHAKANRFWGNLIGVTCYTLVDFPLDGWEFFAEPNHLILGIFSLAIALLQGLRCHWLPCSKVVLVPLESLIRLGMLLALYQALFWKNNEGNLTVFSQANSSQIFLGESLLVIGLLLGLQTLQVMGQQQKLHEIAQKLRHLAEWGMGSYAVSAAVSDPEALLFQRCDRSIVFLDIRGFTQWCETTSPDRVARVLNDYYHCAEPAATRYNPLKVSFTADEVMAIYDRPHSAIAAARAMQEAVQPLLSRYGLGAGCGVHGGSVIEGLFGSDEVRTYTAIGDVVNVAKRLESSTPAGKITLSDAVYQALKSEISVLPREPIQAKGKSQPLTAWYLQ
ncbi:adenylate/guanylate cyclase domain-containing protein [Spirulina sp. 06S082]|uniref:adenylate/guanylate cyclase domain-containing protein n=1 Tax=Spirulina sp. 06S082 TaxID=3110248 RepID=UPI002B2121A3|nr:adenylate/guanylate cyclase domain-containing protein [Spirulina sp. 06S082]MEA5470784.1 adenylate/guanylate cyclase domain-containing protein [Spirulina sp. 06S082]